MNRGAVTGSIFVGRQQEMGELMAALDDALAGQGRLVMLQGVRATSTDHEAGEGVPRE